MKGTTLTQKSDGGQAIISSVNKYWKLYGPDIMKWPTPSSAYDEVANAMGPYGDSEAQRKLKHRTFYNRMIKKCFADNGTCFAARLLTSLCTVLHTTVIIY